MIMTLEVTPFEILWESVTDWQTVSNTYALWPGRQVVCTIMCRQAWAHIMLQHVGRISCATCWALISCGGSMLGAYHVGVSRHVWAHIMCNMLGAYYVQHVGHISCATCWVHDHVQHVGCMIMCNKLGAWSCCNMLGAWSCATCWVHMMTATCCVAKL